jgi:hypothetical protein
MLHCNTVRQIMAKIKFREKQGEMENLRMESGFHFRCMYGRVKPALCQRTVPSSRKEFMLCLRMLLIARRLTQCGAPLLVRWYKEVIVACIDKRAGLSHPLLKTTSWYFFSMGVLSKLLRSLFSGAGWNGQKGIFCSKTRFGKNSKTISTIIGRLS